jgi:biotin-(acetyl-CoA carboxylase) ligase
MKPTNLNNIVEGETYYIQTQNYKFKAVYDRYDKGKFHFKKIIRLNTPKDWIGYIGTYEYMYYTIYESHKSKIQTVMETRAVKKILMEITGTEIY